MAIGICTEGCGFHVEQFFHLLGCQPLGDLADVNGYTEELINVFLAVVVLPSDTADGYSVAFGRGIKPRLLDLIKGHDLFTRIEVQHFIVFLFPHFLFEGCGRRCGLSRCRGTAWQDTMIGIGCQHLLDVGSTNECHAVADTGGVQFANGYKFIDVLTGTAHEGGCFGKGEILLMLYLHEWLSQFEEVVLLHCSGSFGFCLTSLTAIALHSASGLKGLTAKSTFLGYFHTAYRLLISLLHSHVSEVVNGGKQ